MGWRLSKLAVLPVIELPVAADFLSGTPTWQIPTDIEQNTNSLMVTMEFFFLTGCPEPIAAKSKYYCNIAIS